MVGRTGHETDGVAAELANHPGARSCVSDTSALFAIAFGNYKKIRSQPDGENAFAGARGGAARRIRTSLS